MIKDPMAEWDGPFPYDDLAEIGVTPEYTHEEMGDVTYALMARGMFTGRAHQAWHKLHELQDRLLIDVLLYDVDPAGEIEAARAGAEAEPADIGEPPQVADALRMPAQILGGLADEFRRTTSLDRLLQVPVALDVDMTPPLSLIDGMLRFDR